MTVIFTAPANTTARDDIEAIANVMLDTAETFTMREICDALGIDPKIARSRYRAIDNDKVPTNYIFGIEEWDNVAMIISPKRAKKSPAVVKAPVEVPLGF